MSSMGLNVHRHYLRLRKGNTSQSLVSDLPLIQKTSHRSTTSPACSIITATVKRAITCLVLSTAGIVLRLSLIPVGHRIFQDAVAVVLENHLLLFGWNRIGSYLHRSSLEGRVSVSASTLVLKVAHFFLPLIWLIATIGDYTYQVQTGGGLPSLGDIKIGLKNPWLYVSDQVVADYLAFLFVIIRILAGPVVAVAILYWKTKNNFQKRLAPEFLETLPPLLCIFFLLLYLHGFCAAWAPVSNLIWCTTTLAFQAVIKVSVSVAFVKSHPVIDSNYGWWNATLLNHKYINRGTTSVVTQQPMYQVNNIDRLLEGFPENKEHHQRRPNVIIVVHESLSGSALESTLGRRATPFWHGPMQSHPDIYQFKHVLAASGMTSIATSGILTGLIPYDDDGLELLRTTIAADFKGAGYDTACFSSYGTEYSGTYWAILDNLYNDNFDNVFGPKQMGDPVVNLDGIDDRKTVGHFKDWVEGGRNRRRRKMVDDINAAVYPLNNVTSLARDEKATYDKNNDVEDPPFFAVIVLNNNHYPFLKHETYNRNNPPSDKDSRYFSSLRTTDEAIEGIFDILGGISRPNDSDHSDSINGLKEENTKLADTIVMGAGDHGETPNFTKRLNQLDATILQVPMYMHIPNRFIGGGSGSIQNKGLGSTQSNHIDSGANIISHQNSDIILPILNNNTVTHNTHLTINLNRTTSTLDLIPTLRDILGFPLEYTPEQAKNCLTGRSLLKSVVPNDRVVQAWQGPPLLEDNIAVFATSTDILVNYGSEYRKSDSYVALRNFSTSDPFYTQFGVTYISQLSQIEKERWLTILSNWFDHPFVTSSVRGLREAFGFTSLISTKLFEKEWNDIDHEERIILESFGYTKNLWDIDIFTPTELLRHDWKDFTEKEKTVMNALGYNEYIWENNRPTDSWADKYWEEINPNIRHILSSLGFVKETWDRGVFPMDIEQRSWDSFGCKQQWVQVSMGYNKGKWESMKPPCNDVDQHFYEKLNA